MSKPKYYVVIYEIDYLNYHELLVGSYDEQQIIVDMISNVSIDVAENFLLSLINNHNLSDDVEVIVNSYVDGELKERQHQTVGKYLEVIDMV